MTWMTSTWTTQNGVYSWTSHFKPQFILGKIASSWSRLYGEFTIYQESTLKSTIDYKEPTWRSTTLLCDKAFVITNTKTYVFADSVLCLGSMSNQPVEAWKNKITWYLENRYLKDLNRIDGEPMEFEWKIFPGFITLGILEEIQKLMTGVQCEPETFKDRIIFMSLYNDILWWTPGNHENWMAKSRNVAACANKFPQGCWSFWDLDQRRSGTELVQINQTEIGTRLLNEWCSTWQKVVILNFVPTAPWKEENQEAKKRERSLSTSTVAKKTLNWFFARLFL